MKSNFYKKSFPRLTAVVLLFVFFSLFSQVAFAQDSFSSLDNDLAQLENLIADTIANTEEQQRLLEDLRQNLAESGNLIDSYEITIAEQENLLKDLQTQLNAMSETYRMQSALSARYERNSKFWRTFTIIAIPVTAVISGVTVWSLMR